MHWKRYLRVAALIMVIGVSGCSGSTTTPAPSSPPVPQDEAACRARGGVWGNMGMFQIPMCNLPAADAGHLCTSSASCDGYCAPALSLVGYGFGRCSDWTLNFGCFATLEDGRESFRCTD